MSSDAESKVKTHTSSSSAHKKHRSRSTPRYNDVDKPRKKRHLGSGNSFVSIPNTIKLSMLNSGLLPTSKYITSNEQNAKPKSMQNSLINLISMQQVGVIKVVKEQSIKE